MSGTVLLLTTLTVVGQTDPAKALYPIKKSWEGWMKLELRLEVAKPEYLSWKRSAWETPTKAEGAEETSNTVDGAFSAVVMDEKSWQRLWTLLRKDEDLPKVNFREYLVIVTVNANPNQLWIEPRLSEKGHLTLGGGQRLLGFGNSFSHCFYRFDVIDRRGVKTIDGKAFDKQ